MFYIGERIKTKRKELKITQKLLAEKINVNPITIARYESGERDPSIEIIKKIAEALDTNINWFLYEDYDVNKTVFHENGFFTVHNIMFKQDLYNHIADLIKYKIHNYDFSQLSEEEWQKVSNETLEFLEYQLHKLKKTREVSDNNGNKES